MWVAFEHSHFFSKNISVYAIFDDQRVNDTLTNNIVSIDQLGPEEEEKKKHFYPGEPNHQWIRSGRRYHEMSQRTTTPTLRSA